MIIKEYKPNVIFTFSSIDHDLPLPHNSWNVVRTTSGKATKMLNNRGLFWIFFNTYVRWKINLYICMCATVCTHKDNF